jgi:hypothetical protein
MKQKQKTERDPDFIDFTWCSESHHYTSIAPITQK